MNDRLDANEIRLVSKKKSQSTAFQSLIEERSEYNRRFLNLLPAAFVGSLASLIPIVVVFQQNPSTGVSWDALLDLATKFDGSYIALGLLAVAATIVVAIVLDNARQGRIGAELEVGRSVLRSALELVGLLAGVVCMTWTLAMISRAVIGREIERLPEGFLAFALGALACAMAAAGKSGLDLAARSAVYAVEDFQWAIEWKMRSSFVIKVIISTLLASIAGLVSGALDSENIGAIIPANSAAKVVLAVFLVLWMVACIVLVRFIAPLNIQRFWYLQAHNSTNCSIGFNSLLLSAVSH